jgi:hypothetical protein
MIFLCLHFLDAYLARVVWPLSDLYQLLIPKSDLWLANFDGLVKRSSAFLFWTNGRLFQWGIFGIFMEKIVYLVCSC